MFQVGSKNVSGRVLVNVSEPKKMKCLKVQMVGRGEVFLFIEIAYETLRPPRTYHYDTCKTSGSILTDQINMREG